MVWTRIHVGQAVGRKTDSTPRTHHRSRPASTGSLELSPVEKQVQRRKRCDIQNERRKSRRPFWHWRSWSDGQPVQRWPRLRLLILQNNWTGWFLGSRCIPTRFWRRSLPPQLFPTD